MFTGGYFSVQMTSLRNMAGIEYFPQALSVVNVGYGIAGAIAVPLAGKYLLQIIFVSVCNNTI